MNGLIAGIDSGNTKTAFLCVTTRGEVVVRGVTGPSNYQTLGREGCLGRLRSLVQPHASILASESSRVLGWGFGLAGLDRPRDREVLDAITLELVTGVFGHGHCPQRMLQNDAFLSLRAGSDDGVGVAVSAGTSGNCVGMNRRGERLQIGGIAAELGDGGGGFDIAIAGLKAAGRARDGRAPKTLISDLYMSAMGISDIADVVDFMIPGNPGPDIPGENAAAAGIEQPIPPLIGLLAPLVFQAAAMGDIPARNILETFGRDLGVSARVAAFRLGFRPGEEFPLVLGGSVLQKATEPTYRNAIVGEVCSMFPNASPLTLSDHPVVGAVLMGFYVAGIPVTPAIRSAVSIAASGM